MLNLQRRIQVGCDALDYYMNKLFRFKTDEWDGAYERLNEEDKRLFFNGAKVIVPSNSTLLSA